MTIEETTIENKDIEKEVVVETITWILIEKILGINIHKVETLVETRRRKDTPTCSLEVKTEGMVIGQCQDQNQGTGIDLVLE